MTRLDPYIALARAEGVLKRYPRFRSFCQAHRYDRHYLADLEIELELRRDAEERVRRVMKRMGRTVGNEIRALLAQEIADAQEQGDTEEVQAGSRTEGVYPVEAEVACRCEDGKVAEGIEPRGAGEITAGTE